MSRRHLEQRRAAQKSHRKTGHLNLVSLMDIFTILVFFLMVNSSEVEVLQSNSKITLPDSTSEQRPENRLVISISDDTLIVQGRAVASVADIQGSEDHMISGLGKELHYQAGRHDEIPEGGFEVTIMGDQQVPYWLPKKIMYTCQSNDFAKISLAVNKVDPVVDEAPAPGVQS